MESKKKLAVNRNLIRQLRNTELTEDQLKDVYGAAPSCRAGVDTVCTDRCPIPSPGTVGCVPG